MTVLLRFIVELHTNLKSVQLYTTPHQSVREQSHNTTLYCQLQYNCKLQLQQLDASHAFKVDITEVLSMACAIKSQAATAELHAAYKPAGT